ncbi:hypothetical protein [Candidatus Proelusimicrobium excrementi]|nr:hypothetical protein [Elusimicrobiaceae bacterium]
MKLDNMQILALCAVLAAMMFISGCCVGSALGFGDGVRAAVQITGACK